MKKIIKILTDLKKHFGKIPLKRKIVFGLILAAVLGFVIFRVAGSLKKTKVQYQTAQAEKGTLITSISGSGTITSGNYTNITTKTSGTVSKVSVTNGDKVIKGQKIAEINLDEYSQERQTAAWVTYLEAKETALEAKNDKDEADIAMWETRQDVLDAQNALNLVNYYATVSAQPVYTDGQKTIIGKTLDQTRKAFTVAESKYLNANSDISNANAKVSAALRNYQENSATIVAPSAGIVSNLALAKGITVSANSTTSSTSGATIVSAQTVGKISDPNGQLIASVTLSEIDIVNVKANQKVTITLDAYPDNTFTGKVLAVNTSGSISQGVTSYPVTILLDPTDIDIYPNMAVNAEIITNFVTDVILIPSTAVSTDNNQSTVQIMKDGKVEVVSVETGEANDSQTVIVSGIKEGDEVITSTISSDNSQTNTNSTTSPFSGAGNRMMIQERPRGF